MREMETKYFMFVPSLFQSNGADRPDAESDESWVTIKPRSRQVVFAAHRGVNMLREPPTDTKMVPKAETSSSRREI